MTTPDPQVIKALVQAWQDAEHARFKAHATWQNLEGLICDLVDPRRIGDKFEVNGREVFAERRTLVIMGALPEKAQPAVVMYGTLNGREVYIPPLKS